MNAYISGKDFGLPESVMVHRLANIAGELTCGERCRIDAFVTITGKVKLGSNCHIATGSSLFGSEGIEIGDECSTSPGSQIFTTSYDRGSRHQANPMVDDKVYRASPVKIGSRCIIGTNSVVLPGAVVTDDVCIGALSLVNTSIHTPGIYAGIPARLIP